MVLFYDKGCFEVWGLWFRVGLCCRLLMKCVCWESVSVGGMMRGWCGVDGVVVVLLVL